MTVLAQGAVYAARSVTSVMAAHGAHTHSSQPLEPGQSMQPEQAAHLAQSVQSVDWLTISPPAIVALAGLVVLVADLFVPARHKRLLGAVSAVSLLLSAVPLFFLWGAESHIRTFCQAGAPGSRHACGYYADTFTLVIQLLVLGAGFVTALLSMSPIRDLRLPQGEYWFLLLSATAGAALVPASRDLVTLVIALEVASLPAFALVGLRRGSAESGEAALKFFLTSVTATAVTLLGASFLYAVTGTLNLYGISAGLAKGDPQLHALGTAGVALTFVGFAFKASVVPFHFWVPDSYVGAPVPVAAFLSVVGKAAGLSGLLLLVVHAFASRSEIWGPLLAVLAAVTMTIGNAGALGQRPDREHGAVRLLAWSSVGQAGYLLVPLAAAAPAAEGRTGTALATVGATVAYLLMYGAVNLGAFAVVAHVSRVRGANRLDDYRGLYAANPPAALALAFFLLCLAGLPPGVIGLFAKVAVFSTAVDSGLGWLAVIMAVNVVLALFYYLKWTALLFRPARQTARTAAETNAAGTGAGVGTESGDAAGSEDSAVGVLTLPRVSKSLSATIALTVAAGIVLSFDPDLVLTFTAGALR